MKYALSVLMGAPQSCPRPPSITPPMLAELGRQQRRALQFYAASCPDISCDAFLNLLTRTEPRRLSGRAFGWNVPQTESGTAHLEAFPSA